MPPDLKDVTIIGAGPVGLFGAFYAGLRGMSARIIDSLPQPGGQLVALYPDKPIYDMPGFPEIKAAELARLMTIQASRFHPEYCLGEQCHTLTQKEYGWLLTTTKSSYPSKTVIICGGVGSFEPTKLGIPREEDFLGKGLSYGVQNVQDFEGKNVVIVGGGDSAVDWALHLQGIARTITLIHRHDRFRAHEENVKRLFNSPIHVRTWETVEELIGEKELQAIKTLHRKTGEKTVIPCDRLSINIGFKSSLGPILQWGLNISKNQICVNSHMETNLPGVYAAGDICTYDGKLELIATGVGEVCIAVNYAKHAIDPSSKVFPGHSTDMTLPDLPT
jgi:thioredoxin reductase